ncbi:hypothetical protein NC651_026701 [Populus alba x Populus x berolinensis]|nr:hypothetical protein NC651_026701 [Populus alba x Populus x berolinensis]
MFLEIQSAWFRYLILILQFAEPFEILTIISMSYRSGLLPCSGIHECPKTSTQFIILSKKHFMVCCFQAREFIVQVRSKLLPYSDLLSHWLSVFVRVTLFNFRTWRSK